MLRHITTHFNDILHGAVENGRIFYSSSTNGIENKGLAPFLANNGFDVYVLDLRGRGESRPAINRDSTFGQTEAINEDITAAMQYIIKMRGNVPQHWIAHSWGGVLLSSHLARFPDHIPMIKSMVYFASRRKVAVINWKRFLIIDLLWKLVAPIITAIKGYLPARELGFGSDNETKKSHAQSVGWVKGCPWIDPETGFDYGTALKQLILPPILYLAARADYCLGEASDIKAFIAESGEQNSEFVLLSKENGHSHDYGHLSILTHPDAVKEQYLITRDWLKKHD